GESTQEASRWVAVARSRGVEAVALNRSFVALSKNIKAATDGGDKQIETFKAGEATLESLKGPTGGYRAPILLQGRTLLVGFNEEALRSLL
ncbi:MAG TPA: hypothetical protein PK413_08365, partial [Thermoanaerobaculia bacterium]|nr:hypothetical protein [Thermoanaerobaculia bacterium]